MDRRAAVKFILEGYDSWAKELLDMLAHQPTKKGIFLCITFIYCFVSIVAIKKIKAS